MLYVFVIATTISISGRVSTLESDVPQEVCTSSCEFAYPVEYAGIHMGNTLTVRAYNVPDGQWNNKKDFVLIEKTFGEDEISQMETISTKYGDKLKGRLQATGCTFMEFSSGEGSGGGTKCNLM